MDVLFRIQRAVLSRAKCHSEVFESHCQLESLVIHVIRGCFGSFSARKSIIGVRKEMNTGCRRQQILLYTSLYLLLRSVLVPCLGSFLGFPGNRQMSPLKNDDTTLLFPVSKLSVRIARWSHHYNRVSGWHQQRQLRPPLALQFQLLQHCIPMLPIRWSLFGRLHNRRKEFL